MSSKLTSAYEDKEPNVFKSRQLFVLILLYRIVGLSNTLILPQIALVNGALGCLISLFFAYIFLGIPVTYMELTISQYTGRDCIDMWQIRPCLSHVGYFVQFWQCLMFLYNHAIISLLIHYLIITLGNPPLYSQCGYWSTNMCNIIKVNHTANQQCIRTKDFASIKECEDLFSSYPEYQYYTFKLFGGKKHEFYISWPICVASFVVVIIVFFNCFRRITSIRWFIYPMTIYPFVSYLILLIGSMRQKGLILYYGEALDAGFEQFKENYKSSNILLQTLYSVGAGSGIISNLASLAPFRSPCFSNAATVVVVSAIFSTVAIATSAMMACPYAFEYGSSPKLIINHPVSFAFIKLPRMLSEYDNQSRWLLLAFTCHCVLGINNHIIMFYSILEAVAKRHHRIGKYSAISTLIAMIVLFIMTMPTLGTIGKDIISRAFRKCIFIVSIFYALLESIVFMIWYGFDRFYEDIHFMQGIQPKSYMKVSWMLLSVVLSYVFFQDLVSIVKTPKCQSEYIGFVMMLAGILLPVLIFLIKLVVAAFQKRFMQQFKLDALWGPQCEVLRRSRAMFTAHAMTKEYMYRQYHLQAGIVQRQQISNMRSQVDRNTLKANP